VLTKSLELFPACAVPVSPSGGMIAIEGWSTLAAATPVYRGADCILRKYAR
jgi:hypothetical protein